MKSSFAFFLRFFVHFIVSDVGVLGLSVLIFCIPMDSFSVWAIIFSLSPYFVLASWLVWLALCISVLNFSHHSLLLVFHLYVSAFHLGLLIFIFIMMVLWCVGVPSLVLILKASSWSITFAVVLFVTHFVVTIWSTTERFSGLFHSCLVHCPLFTLVVAATNSFLFIVSCRIFPFLDSFWLIWSILILALKSPPWINSVVFSFG